MSNMKLGELKTRGYKKLYHLAIQRTEESHARFLRENTITDDSYLICCFSFPMTPEGYKFWNKINKGVFPEEFRDKIPFLKRLNIWYLSHFTEEKTWKVRYHKKKFGVSDFMTYDDAQNEADRVGGKVFIDYYNYQL